jgi:acyl carrier protein
MDDISARLTRCFAAVFPALALRDIPNAEPAAVTGWDSVASVTLIATIEEEFGTELDTEEIAGFLSFRRLHAYLQSHSSAPRP